MQEGHDSALQAVSQAEEIIDAKVVDFMQWLAAREAVPTIRALRDQAERARRHEVERALRRLEKGESPGEVLEALSQALTNKLMHGPTSALHHAQRAGPRYAGPPARARVSDPHARNEGRASRRSWAS